MKQFRYIIDGDATRRTSASAVKFYANNQIPADVDVCFRIAKRKDTDMVREGGYSVTHDTRRLEELGIMLRIRTEDGWGTLPMDPDDTRTRAQIRAELD